jgi:integrase
MDIERRIGQANNRLKAGKVGVAIEMRGDRLLLRATLPPKPESSKFKPHQQRLSLGIHANPAGVSIAEKEARKVGALIDCHQFNWEPYLKEKTSDSAGTIGEWIARFEEEYFQRRKRTFKTESTWKGDYIKVLHRLPEGEALTLELLRELILTTEPDTKSRKRFCMVLTALARFAGLESDFQRLAGNYSPRRVSPRNLPEDELIAEWYTRLKNPGWKWIFGMIATYGLRPHEAFCLDYAALRSGSVVASVLAGKTGARRVWPFYPEWHEMFNLSAVHLPPISLERNHTAIGGSACRYFRGIGLPFHLYDLRHCWAIRTLECGLDISLAAQQMGHSVQVHSQQYHLWISERHHQRAFEQLRQKSDRPMPPMLPVTPLVF